ncbi:hypothetical protein DPMN_108282 [Dreissena polymorpha]|uniref:Uncharacterized protein n=1 Tax=Dreissena polymorpha TaxID=45954 RepID=A0A9D4K8L5_DREPO|nr:hypothetical protein DPMN_108282 [Dreissena polymorpha]
MPKEEPKRSLHFITLTGLDWTETAIKIRELEQQQSRKKDALRICDICPIFLEHMLPLLPAYLVLASGEATRDRISNKVVDPALVL